MTGLNTLAFNWTQGLDGISLRLRVGVIRLTTPTPFSPSECAVKYHNILLAGPHVVRQSNEQKLVLGPKYSLKKVLVRLQAGILTIKL